MLAAVSFACAPETDRERYEVGDPGIATFSNRLNATLHLAGCTHFDYEQRIGDAWVPQGPDAYCVWEGTAQPVLPGAVQTDWFYARTPGRWRLRYGVGFGCSDEAPLSENNCAAVATITSNEFEVSDATSCNATGCSGQLCAEQPIASTCEWLPHYACFREARCGHFGSEGSCGWEQTPELAACLARFGLDRGGLVLETPR